MPINDSFQSLSGQSKLGPDRTGAVLTALHLPLSNMQHSLGALHPLAGPLRHHTHSSVPRDSKLGSTGHVQQPLSTIARESIATSSTSETQHEPADIRRMETSTPHDDSDYMADTLAGTRNVPYNSLASRRRRRYRSLPLAVRQIATNRDMSSSPSLDFTDDEAQHMDTQVDDSDRAIEGELLRFRKLTKRGVSRSALDYLLLEGRVELVSLISSAITTAEQEFRSKQRARVWRQEVTKVKARHILQRTALDKDIGDEPLARGPKRSFQHHRHECAGALASRLCDSKAHDWKSSVA